MTKPAYDSFAAFYDLEYGHKENDLDFYLDMAEQFGDPVLEIGVGTGRVALDLAANGFNVVGIDNSLEMLQVAKKNVRTLNKKDQSRIQLFQADMRDFSLDQKFPLVTIPFRAFLHNLTMDDQLATLRAIRNHLEPEGILAFDLFVPLYSVMSQKEWHEKIDKDELADSALNVSINVNVKHKAAEQLLIIQNTYVENNSETRHVAEMDYRYVFRYEMEALLRCAGYKIVDVFGGFEQQPYDFFSGIMVFLAALDSSNQ